MKSSIRALITPLDKETIILGSVAKTGRLMVADEGHKTGRRGLGEIAAIVAEEALWYAQGARGPDLFAGYPGTVLAAPLEQAFITRTSRTSSQLSRRLMEFAMRGGQ